MPMFNKPLSEYQRFMEELNNYNECEDEELDLFLEDANLDKLKALLGDDYYKDVYVPFKNKIASKVKVGEDEDGNPIMGENPDLKLKRTDYLLKTYSKNPQALKDLIANYKTRTSKIKEEKIDGAKYLGSNGDYDCYRITKYPAAKHYGENTTWCITGRYKGEKERGEYYFNKYINDEGLDGGYYFFLHKTNPRRKYALLQQVDKKDKKHPLKIHSVWSALNSPLTLDRLPILPQVKEIPELKDVYKDVDIENPEHIQDRDRKSLEHDILISCQLPEESFKDAVRNVKEILDGEAYKDYKFDLDNIKDESDCTPLLLACSNGNTELVKLLLEHGAEVNSKDEDGNSSLFMACSLDKQNTELVNLLLEHGAEVNSKTDYESTPLVVACDKGNLEVVKLLIEHGAEVNSKNEYGSTPLSTACSNNNTEVVKLLIEHGAEVNSKNEYGSTPLSTACENNNTEVAKLLIENGADVNFKDKDGDTPLYEACIRKNTELIKLLLEHGADVNFKNRDGYTPLYWACVKDDTEVAKLLLEHGADVNIKQKKYGETPLNVACIKDNIDIVKLLLEYGADVNNKNKNGEVPLLWSCKNNKTELVKLLLEYDVDVNIRDKDGWTPLYWACYHNNIELAKLLLEHGADPNIKDDGRETPLYWACYHNNTELAKLLLEHGADVNSESKYGDTPLNRACYHNNTELAKLLIEHGADVNSKDKYGRTPLYHAYSFSNIELAKLLLEHGAGKDFNVNNLPEYITRNKEIEDLIFSYMNKGRNESIILRKLYRL